MLLRICVLWICACHDPYISDTVFNSVPLTRDEMDQVMEVHPGAKPRSQTCRMNYLPKGGQSARSSTTSLGGFHEIWVDYVQSFYRGCGGSALWSRECWWLLWLQPENPRRKISDWWSPEKFQEDWRTTSAYWLSLMWPCRRTWWEEAGCCPCCSWQWKLLTLNGGTVMQWNKEFLNVIFSSNWGEGI